VCRQFGLLHYHTHDSRKSEEGFPDSVIVGPSRVLFRELKGKTGKLGPDQIVWRDTLLAAGADWALWRPADMEDIVSELKELQQ
jgi:hypothetical protein